MIGVYPLIGPILRRIDPETAHGLAIAALKTGMVPTPVGPDSPRLRSQVWGRTFANPIGLAAGFDKNGEVADAMLAQGFGFVEVGSVTPRAQPGNLKPRLFRLPADRAVINRMGFNNDGADAAAARLSNRRRGGGWIGVNLGKNKDSGDALDDYLIGIERLARYADYVVVNVSSPNTPGLRALQGRDPLARLLSGVRRGLDRLSLDPPPPPLLLKVAPDLTDDDERGIAEVVLDEGIDGLIATNTTIDRPQSLSDGRKTEAGGLSGAPLFEPSTRVLADFHGLTRGRLPLIGVGGVFDGAGAYRKIRAGASLVQLYSALVYEGPALVGRIKRDLAALLEKDGFGSVSEAVGADHR